MTGRPIVRSWGFCCQIGLNIACFGKLPAARGEHYAGGQEYKIYTQLLAQNPALSLRNQNSVRLESSRQMVELGLMAI